MSGITNYFWGSKPPVSGNNEAPQQPAASPVPVPVANPQPELQTLEEKKVKPLTLDLPKEEDAVTFEGKGKEEASREPPATKSVQAPQFDSSSEISGSSGLRRRREPAPLPSSPPSKPLPPIPTAAAKAKKIASQNLETEKQYENNPLFSLLETQVLRMGFPMLGQLYGKLGLQFSQAIAEEQKAKVLEMLNKGEISRVPELLLKYKPDLKSGMSEEERQAAEMEATHAAIRQFISTFISTQADSYLGRLKCVPGFLGLTGTAEGVYSAAVIDNIMKSLRDNIFGSKNQEKMNQILNLVQDAILLSLKNTLIGFNDVYEKNSQYYYDLSNDTYRTVIQNSAIAELPAHRALPQLTKDEEYVLSRKDEFLIDHTENIKTQKQINELTKAFEEAKKDIQDPDQIEKQTKKHQLKIEEIKKEAADRREKEINSLNKLTLIERIDKRLVDEKAYLAEMQKNQDFDFDAEITQLKTQAALLQKSNTSKYQSKLKNIQDKISEHDQIRDKQIAAKQSLIKDLETLKGVENKISQAELNYLNSITNLVYDYVLYPDGAPNSINALGSVPRDLATSFVQSNINVWSEPSQIFAMINQPLVPELLASLGKKRDVAIKEAQERYQKKINELPESKKAALNVVKWHHEGTDYYDVAVAEVKEIFKKKEDELLTSLGEESDKIVNQYNADYQRVINSSENIRKNKDEQMFIDNLQAYIDLKVGEQMKVVSFLANHLGLKDLGKDGAKLLVKRLGARDAIKALIYPAIDAALKAIIESYNKKMVVGEDGSILVLDRT